MRRATIRPRVLAEKSRRRVHVGGLLTFLFENQDTVRYQVQEMMRIERIVKEADILHELATYNELLGGHGELGATLLIEIDGPREVDSVVVRHVGASPGYNVRLIAAGLRRGAARATSPGWRKVKSSTFCCGE